MSEQNTIESVAERAMLAAKTAMGVREDKDVYDMNGTDQGNVTAFATAIVEWDAARMDAEAARSRRKPTPPEARC